MADGTKIEWAHATWNAVVGCDKVSQGCVNCYATKMARRLELMGQKKYMGLTVLQGSQVQWSGKVSFDESALLKPLAWKKPKRIFVTSMGDPNHENVTDLARDKMLAVIAEAEQHDFLWLTKRPADMDRYYASFGADEAEDRGMTFAAWCIGTLGEEAFERILAKRMWRGLPNLWVGTSVENAEQKRRIDELRKVPAKVRFLSCEPLLGDLGEVDLTGIHWVIAGGESGPNARPLHPDWARSLRDQCKDAGVPFFFKQWGEWIPWEPEQQPCWVSQHGKSEDHHALFPENIADNPAGWDSGLGFEEEESQPAFQKVGKKAAGHLLDGVEHHAFPEVRNA